MSEIVGIDNKQDKLTTTQLAAVNSGITSEIISNKQDKLTVDIQPVTNPISGLKSSCYSYGKLCIFDGYFSGSVDIDSVVCVLPKPIAEQHIAAGYYSGNHASGGEQIFKLDADGNLIIKTGNTASETIYIHFSYFLAE